jgi:hypothetical protein
LLDCFCPPVRPISDALSHISPTAVFTDAHVVELVILLPQHGPTYGVLTSRSRLPAHLQHCADQFMFRVTPLDHLFPDLSQSLGRDSCITPLQLSRAGTACLCPSCTDINGFNSSGHDKCGISSGMYPLSYDEGGLITATKKNKLRKLS